MTWSGRHSGGSDTIVGTLDEISMKWHRGCALSAIAPPTLVALHGYGKQKDRRRAAKRASNIMSSNR
jgi:hypothetical protein